MESRKLDFAERWMRDGLEIIKTPAMFHILHVDMSRSKQLLETARQMGVRLTYGHILTRATAVALARHPDLHVMASRRRLSFPSQVDIGLSIAGDDFVTPVLVLEAADCKDLLTLAKEIIERAPEAGASDKRLKEILRRWGAVLPFAFLRRAFLRVAFRFPEFRRKGVGTFQVSIVSGVDCVFSSVFNTCGFLSAGAVRDTVTVVNGQPAVRPVMAVTCCADHRIWNGKSSERLLKSLQQILEGGELDRELVNVQELSARSAAAAT